MKTSSRKQTSESKGSSMEMKDGISKSQTPAEALGTTEMETGEGGDGIEKFSQNPEE